MERGAKGVPALWLAGETREGEEDEGKAVYGNYTFHPSMAGGKRETPLIY